MKRHIVRAIDGVVTNEEVEMTPAEQAAFEVSRVIVLPAPEDTNLLVDDLARALITKGILTDTDIINAKKARL